MNNNLFIEEFFVHAKKPEQTHTILHITDPKTPDPEDGGFFIVLLEFTHGSKNDFLFLQNIIHDAESDWYDQKNTFEDLLGKINAKMQGWINEKHRKLHFFIGTVNDGIIRCAFFGRPHVYVLYKTKYALKEMALHKEYRAKSHATENEPPFKDTLEGPIKSGDHFMILSPLIEAHLSFEHIKQYLELYGPKECAKLTQRTLETKNIPGSVAGAIIHMPSQTANIAIADPAIMAHKAKTDSMIRLGDKKKKTEQTLSPSIAYAVFQFIRKKITSKTKPEKNNLKKESQENQDDFFAPEEKREQTQKKSFLARYGKSNSPQKSEKPKGFVETVLVYIGKTIFTIFSMGVGIGVRFIKLFKTASAKNTGTGIQHKKTEQQLFERFKNKPRMFTYSIFIILLIVIGVSTLTAYTVKNKKEQKNTDDKNANNSVLALALENKKNEVESVLLYGNTERALEILIEMDRIADGLSEDTEIEKQEKNGYKEFIRSQLQIAQNVTLIEPMDIVPLPETVQNGSPTQIAFINGKITLFNELEAKLFTLDQQTEEVKEITHGSVQPFTAFAPTKDMASLWFISGTNTLTVFEKNTNILAIKSIVFPKENASVHAMAIFNKNLYTVDTENKQIYKHTPVQNGFGKGAEWLKTPFSILDKTIAIAIDGSIFCLLENGKIIKFDKGAGIILSLAPVYPGLEKPKNIFTSANTENLYIFEPKNARILVYKKTGAFVTQIQSEAFKNPESLFIDFEQKSAYVLNSDSVMQFKFTDIVK